MATTNTSITADQLQSDLSLFGQSVDRSQQLLSTLMHNAFSGMPTESVSSSQLGDTFPDGSSVTIVGQNLNTLSDGTFMAGTSQPVTIDGINVVGPSGSNSTASVGLHVTLTESAGAGTASGTLTSFTSATPYLGVTIDFGGTAFTIGQPANGGPEPVQNQPNEFDIKSINVWFNEAGGGIANAAGTMTLSGNMKFDLATQAYSGSMTSLHLVENGQTVDLSGFVVPFEQFFNGVSNSVIYAEMVGQGSQVIAGGSGNDTLYDLAGNNIIDGGGGINTLVYAGNFANNRYTLTKTSTGYTVTDNTGSGGTDTLTNVQRLQFADRKIAVDLSPTGSAGETVEIIGAAFGMATLSNKSYVGIGVSLFDGGYTMQQVAQLCINTGAVSASDNTSFVKAVWLNVVGSAIDAGNLSTFTGMLQGSGGTMSQAALLQLAATCQANIDHVGMVGMATTGIEYI